MCTCFLGGGCLRTGNNIRLRKDGRYEARYIKGRSPDAKIIYGYVYGKTYQEAEEKRDALLHQMQPIKELNLLILGAGSHGQEVLELAQSLRIFHKIGFLDDTKPEIAIGPCNNFSKYLSEYPVAIPAIGDTEVRKRWMTDLVKAGFIIPTLIHPSAVVSRSAEIGNGTVVCARATIGPRAQLGKGCIISCGATIDKNVIMRDWAYVDCGEIVSAQSIKVKTK